MIEEFYNKLLEFAVLNLIMHNYFEEMLSSKVFLNQVVSSFVIYGYSFVLVIIFTVLIYLVIA